MFRAPILVITSIFLAIGACANPTSASQTVDSPIGDFESIRAFSGIDVQLIQSDKRSIKIDVVKGQRDDVVVNQTDKHIEIGFSTENVDREISVKVYAPNIEKIEADRGATIIAEKMQLENITIIAKNGGTVSIGGKCNTLVAIAASGGSINAQTLSCNRVNIHAEDQGSVNLNPLTKDVKSNVLEDSNISD